MDSSVHGAELNPVNTKGLLDCMGGTKNLFRCELLREVLLLNVSVFLGRICGSF